MNTQINPRTFTDQIPAYYEKTAFLKGHASLSVYYIVITGRVKVNTAFRPGKGHRGKHDIFMGGLTKKRI